MILIVIHIETIKIHIDADIYQMAANSGYKMNL